MSPRLPTRLQLAARFGNRRTTDEILLSDDRCVRPLRARVLRRAALAFGDGTPDESPPAEERVCEDAGLMGSALGLCIAFCEANDCDTHPDGKACEIARQLCPKHRRARLPLRARGAAADTVKSGCVRNVAIAERQAPPAAGPEARKAGGDQDFRAEKSRLATLSAASIVSIGLPIEASTRSRNVQTGLRLALRCGQDSATRVRGPICAHGGCAIAAFPWHVSCSSPGCG